MTAEQPAPDGVPAEQDREIDGALFSLVRFWAENPGVRTLVAGRCKPLRDRLDALLEATDSRPAPSRREPGEQDQLRALVQRLAACLGRYVEADEDPGAETLGALWQAGEQDRPSVGVSDPGEGEPRCTNCTGSGLEYVTGYYMPGEQFVEPPSEGPCGRCAGTGMGAVQALNDELDRLRARSVPDPGSDELCAAGDELAAKMKHALRWFAPDAVPRSLRQFAAVVERWESVRAARSVPGQQPAPGDDGEVCDFDGGPFHEATICVPHAAPVLVTDEGDYRVSYVLSRLGERPCYQYDGTASAAEWARCPRVPTDARVAEGAPSPEVADDAAPTYFCGACGDTGEILRPLSGDSAPCNCPAATGEPYPPEVTIRELRSELARAWEIAGGGRCRCGEVAALTRDGRLVEHATPGGDTTCEASGTREHEPPALTVRLDDGGSDTARDPEAELTISDWSWSQIPPPLTSVFLLPNGRYVALGVADPANGVGDDGSLEWTPRHLTADQADELAAGLRVRARALRARLAEQQGGGDDRG